MNSSEDSILKFKIIMYNKYSFQNILELMDIYDKMVTKIKRKTKYLDTNSLFVSDINNLTREKNNLSTLINIKTKKLCSFLKHIGFDEKNKDIRLHRENIKRNLENALKFYSKGRNINWLNVGKCIKKKNDEDDIKLLLQISRNKFSFNDNKARNTLVINKLINVLLQRVFDDSYHKRIIINKLGKEQKKIVTNPLTGTMLFGINTPMKFLRYDKGKGEFEKSLLIPMPNTNNCKEDNFKNDKVYESLKSWFDKHFLYKSGKNDLDNAKYELYHEKKSIHYNNISIKSIANVQYEFIEDKSGDVNMNALLKNRNLPDDINPNSIVHVFSLIPKPTKGFLKKVFENIIAGRETHACALIYTNENVYSLGMAYYEENGKLHGTLQSPDSSFMTKLFNFGRNSKNNEASNMFRLVASGVLGKNSLAKLKKIIKCIDEKQILVEQYVTQKNCDDLFCIPALNYVFKADPGCPGYDKYNNTHVGNLVVNPMSNFFTKLIGKTSASNNLYDTYKNCSSFMLWLFPHIIKSTHKLGGICMPDTLESKKDPSSLNELENNPISPPKKVAVKNKPKTLRRSVRLGKKQQRTRSGIPP